MFDIGIYFLEFQEMGKWTYTLLVPFAADADVILAFLAAPPYTRYFAQCLRTLCTFVTFVFGLGADVAEFATAFADALAIIAAGYLVEEFLEPVAFGL